MMPPADASSETLEKYSSEKATQANPPSYEQVSLDVKEGEAGSEVDLERLESVRNDAPKRCRRRRCESGKGRRAVWVFFRLAAFIFCLTGIANYFFEVDIFRMIRVASSKSHHMDVKDYDCKQTTWRASSNPREIIIDNGASSIWGTYRLYDLLSLSTTSGSIAVAVIPEPADPNDPDEPARVSIRTKSGSVAVSFVPPHETSSFADGLARLLPLPSDEGLNPLADLPGHLEPKPKHKKHKHSRKANKNHANENHSFWKKLNSPDPTDGCGMPAPHDIGDATTTLAARSLPPRPYEIDIHTEFGSISARVLFASSATLVSETGSLSAVLTPVVYPGLPAENISIYTVTGRSQSVRLTSPLVLSSDNDDEEGLAKPDGPSGAGNVVLGAVGAAQAPTATHIAARERSASLHVSYPDSWAGEVNAHAADGAICLEGKGLVVYKDGKGHATGNRDPVQNGWWGADGNMFVSLEAAESGSIMFAAA